MSDRLLDHQIDVLSGAAEQRLHDEKYRIIADHEQQKSLPLIKRMMLARMAEPVSGLLPTVAALTDFERRHYSVKNLIANLSRGDKDLALEGEISASISKDIGSVPPHGGQWIPLKVTASGLDTKTNTSGQYLVSTKASPDIIDALRAKSVCLRLGAQMVTGLKWGLQIPVEGNILNASWVSENPTVDVTASDPSFGIRSLHAHELQAATSFSRELFQQSSANVETWITSRMAKSHALMLDKAAMFGSGTANQPLGLAYVSGVGVVAIGTNGGAVTTANLIAMESAVADANGDQGSMAFVTNSTQRAKLRLLPEMTGGVIPVWKDDRVLGYTAVASNQIPNTLTKGTSVSTCSAVIFGDWSALNFFEWGGAIEVIYDPFTQKKNNMVEITSYGSYDSTVAQVGSFSVILDAI